MTHCIGWHDPDGCPHYGGEYHGCRHNEHHSPFAHRCICGATLNAGPVRMRRKRRRAM